MSRARPRGRPRPVSVLAAVVALVPPWTSACQFPDYQLDRVPSGAGAGIGSSAGSADGGSATQASGGSDAGGTAGAGGATGALGGTAGQASAGSAPGGAGGAGGSTGGVDGGAPGDPNLLLSDDFESGSSSWLEVAGSPWSVALDAGSASSGFQLSPVFSDFYVAIAKDGKWADQSITAKVKVLAFGGTGTGDVVSLIARFNSLDDYYAAVLRPDGRAAIRARVAGAPTASIKTSPNFGVVAGTWYEMRFELVGSSLRLYVDGVLRVEAQDERIAEGTVALGGENSAAIFDDVSVVRP